MAGDNHRLVDSISVRVAKLPDLPRLEWGGELVHFRNIFTDAYRNFEHGTGLIWIAEETSFGLVGQAMVSLLSNRHDLSDGKSKAYLYGFRVRPNFQNQGVGTLLMNAIEDDLRMRGYQILTLNVAKTNSSALRLYKRLGYEIVSPEPGEWSYVDHEGHRREVREPAWRMEKLLSSS